MKGIPKVLVSVALIVALLAMGLGVAGWLFQTKPTVERTLAPRLPPVVEVQTLERRDLQEVYTGYGTARAAREVTLTAEVSGEVVELAEDLDDGSPVTAGQLLVRTDDRSYVQQLRRAESLVADAEAQLERIEVEKTNARRLAAIAEQEVLVNRDEVKRLSDLYEMNQASKKEVDFARLAYQRSRREWQRFLNEIDLMVPRRAAGEAALGARRAEAELARLEVEKCRIVAPFAGQVDRLMVEVGDRVLPGSPVLRLVNLDSIEVPIELPVSVRSRIANGDGFAAVRLHVESARRRRDREWQGRVCRLSPVADQRSRTFAAYVEVDNRKQSAQGGPLIPGYFVTAEVEGPLLRQVLAIPRGVIVEDHVFVVNDDVAHLRTVVIDRLVGELAVISSGLESGDALILTNLDVLFDGAPVRVQTGRPPPPRKEMGHAPPPRPSSTQERDE